MSLARAVLLLAATTTALQIPFMTKDVKVTSSTAKKFDLLVVGAGSGGIGAAIARALAEAGAAVCLAARRGERISALADELRRRHSFLQSLF